MAASPCILNVAFVVLSLCVLVQSETENYNCPSACTCLGSMVDCSKLGLRSIPPDLPHWVTILELQSNKIESIPEGIFNGLHLLEELDLSNNKIAVANTSVFQPLPALEKLVLSYNNLTEIPNVGPNNNLTTLILNHNKITTINGEKLENLTKLRTLDLNFNLVTELKIGMFPPHPHLHQIMLTNNKIKFLESGCLDNLTSLEVLKLRKNKIANLPKHVFEQLSRLKRLDLSQNRLRSLEGLSFKGLRNLSQLKLRRNSIAELMDGTFYGLSAIQTLHLDHNNISAVTKGWLYGLESLQELSLANNHISSIQPDGWECCELLRELDLSYNELDGVVERSFEKLHKLKLLYLNHNHISHIGDGAFAGLESLEILELNNNEISWTIEDMNGAFDGLKSLKRLSLNGNQIKSLTKHTFQGLELLRQLHLVGNTISSIQSNAFSPIPSLRELLLNTTSLLCDCQLAWLPHWLTESGFRNSVNARCAHPASLNGRSIFDVSSDDFKCSDFPKPVIVIEPESTEALRNDNVTLRCAAASSSDSPMTILWKKDNVILPSGNIENTATTEDGEIKKYTTLLHLRNIQSTEEGRYQCVISNHLGSTYSQKAKITVHVYPSFTKTPDDITVRASTAARLECAATGLPQPVIAWQKDGGDDFPAARERRMHVMPTDDVFFIVNVKSDDEGVYSCTATNAAGTISANATLHVLETPAFLRVMEDKMTEEGETTVLECMASGSPKPKLEWWKDGEPLEVTDRHFFTAENQLLIIVQTTPSDAGRYTCEISNTLGTERGISKLKVVAAGSRADPSSAGIDDNSTRDGIIIIAVVCCVVGTSLIWVIIIYHTRKKSEDFSSTPTDETMLPGEMASPYHMKKEKVSSPATYGKYTSVELGDGRSLTPPRLFGQSRMAALFPSELDDDDLNQTLPLTFGEMRAADASESPLPTVEIYMPRADSSMNGVHHLHQGGGSSDSDTINSSSPSTHSTRSTQSTGLLHTFHPSPHPHQPDNQALTNSQPSVAVVHAVPSNGLGQNFVHTMEDGRKFDSHHGTRPPDTQAGLGDECSSSSLPRRPVTSSSSASSLPRQMPSVSSSATFPSATSHPSPVYSHHTFPSKDNDSSIRDWCPQVQPPSSQQPHSESTNQHQEHLPHQSQSTLHPIPHNLSRTTASEVPPSGNHSDHELESNNHHVHSHLHHRPHQPSPAAAPEPPAQHHPYTNIDISPSDASIPHHLTNGHVTTAHLPIVIPQYNEETEMPPPDAMSFVTSPTSVTHLPHRTFVPAGV